MTQLDHLAVASAFNRIFVSSRHTVMVGGASEPCFEPATDRTPALLHYREDFAASALHEAAHWCIAGPVRRRTDDFGYDYIAPPRNDRDHRRFVALEAKVQALERVFAGCAGLTFRVSLDDVDASDRARREGELADAVDAASDASEAWLSSPRGVRAVRLCAALTRARLG